ncbi:MAG: hypothetical protein K6G83_15430 [Lachnospiraceae bacterium]|nr:hypothetical protein [Lachnospiraceae bacterium]
MTVLRITGIVLLCILVLILLLALAILFIPVRYRGEGQIDAGKGILTADAVASWFFHILTLRMHYDGKAEISLLLFGFPVRRRKKKRRKSRRRGKKRRRSGHAGKGHREVASRPESASQKEEEPAYKLETYEDLYPEEATSQKEPSQNAAAEDASLEDSEEKKNIFEKLAEFFGKLADFFRHFKEKLANAEKKLMAVYDNAAFYISFFSDEENQAQLSHLYKQLTRLLKHIKPKRFRLFIHFGFEQPDMTGKLLGLLAIAYPFFGGGLQAEPDFENSVFDMSLFMKGRATVFTVLWIAFRIYYHKGFREMRDTFRNKTR